MVNYFIYATDDSLSTYLKEYFNTKGLETVQSFNDEVEILINKAENSDADNRIVYLHWSDRVVTVTETDLVCRYRQLDGQGGDKEPQKLLNWLTENVTEKDTIRLLYVITDGAVHPSKISAGDPNLKIENVTFHAFDSNVDNINMSVASMFMCNNKSYIVYCNEELVDQTDLSKPFDYDQITVENFHEKKEELKSYIKLQFLTKFPWDKTTLDEIIKLNRLRSRLFRELEAVGNAPETPTNLNVQDKETFIKEFKRSTFYQTLTSLDRCSLKQDIDSSISILINYLNNDKKSYRLDNIKFTQKFTPVTVEEDPEYFYCEDAPEIAFPDIITYKETGIPVLLLTHYNLFDKILFKSEGEDQTSNTAHFSRFRNMLECPLMLLHDEHFKKSIDYFYNLEAFKSMNEHGIKTGPHTGKEFTGAIVPHEGFDDYNDYVLSCTYFGKREVEYNRGLFYYVIYKTCEKLEYIEPNVVGYLRYYAAQCITKTQCYVGLSGVSIDNPKIKVYLPTALWYCVELSSVIFKNDPKHFTKEKLRMYSDVVDYMKEILVWFGYDVDTSSVDVRVDIFKHLKQLRRIPRPEDKVMFILEQIFEKKNGFLVSEIVKPNNIYKLNYLKMDYKKVVDDTAVSAEVDLHEFVHFMDYVEDKDVSLCRQTLRPNYVTNDKQSFYEQLKMKSKRVIVSNGKLTLEPVSTLEFSRILPLYNLYILYVEQNSKFPTLEDFELFVLKKKRSFRSKLVVFDTNILTRIEDVCRKYTEIVNDPDNPIDVLKFIETTRQSANRKHRIKLENPVGFDMSTLLDYIKQTESGVVCEGGES